MLESKLLANSYKLGAKDKVIFVKPSKTVPLSVTGGACALNCKHCNKHYLGHMLTWSDKIPAGTKSILLSGGSNREGVVDLEPYGEQISKLKKKYRINAHLGLITKLPSYLIDVVSFDFPASEEIIRKVYHLNKTFTDYVESYQLLNSKFPTEVHLTIGLEAGQVRGEFEALEILSKLGVKQLVLNVFIPTTGTPMAELDPPNLEDVTKVLAKARDLFETVASGCMRPAGQYREELDLRALDLGFDMIVQPTKKVQVAAQKRGLEVSDFDECCAFLLSRN